MMKKQDVSQVKLKHLSAAVLAVLAASPALALAATPSPTQLPGVGAVVTGSATGSYTAGTNAGTITATGPTVIQWGGTLPSGATPASINTGGTAGFDIGSGASLSFKGTGSVLNIDASGNPSQILGTLDGTTGLPVFVANANGIVVGSNAVISVPGGLGLINASLGASAATDFAGGSLGLSFTGVTGGVTIESGADLSGTIPTGKLLVAGAGAVNVNFAGVKGATEATLNIDGGIPATVSNNNFTLTEMSAGSTSYSSLGAPVNTTVTLGLGQTGTVYLTTAPFSFNTGSQVLVYGNLVNTGLIGALGTGNNLTYGSMAPDTEWSGTFTNNGTIYTNNFTNLSSTNATANAKYLLGSSGSVAPAIGSFVNASGAVLNIDALGVGNRNLGAAGSFTNSGSVTYSGSSAIAVGANGSVINTGTINVVSGTTLTVNAGQNVSLGGTIDFSSTASAAGSLAVTATSGSINYDATVSFGTTGSYWSAATLTALSGSVTLASALNLSSSGTNALKVVASTTAGSINVMAPISVAGSSSTSVVSSTFKASVINVGATMAVSNTNSSGSASALFSAASSINVNSGLTVSAAGGSASASFNLSNASAAPTFSVGSSGSVSAGVVTVSGSNPTSSPTVVNKPIIVVDNGKISASSVTLGTPASPTHNGFKFLGALISSIKGSGSITTGTLTVNNLLGNFNNATGSNPLKNGFALTAMGTSPMNVIWSTAGQSKQAINLNITGDAVLSASNINNPTSSNIVAGAGSLVTPNAGSNLLVQASGTLQIGANGDSSFAFPGGVAFVSAKGITQQVALYNGWSTSPVAFQGVFYTAPSIILNNSNIYTNANTWANFSTAPNVLPTVYSLSYNSASGNYSYVAVPNTATGSLVHQNDYSTLANTAASGGNWVAQVNTTPISSLGQFK